MSTGVPQVPTGVAVRRLDSPASALKSDAPSLLDRWGAADEKALRDAQAFIEQTQARRNMAVQAVDEALSRAGFPQATALRDALIAGATDIRAALAAFDVRVAP